MKYVQYLKEEFKNWMGKSECKASFVLPRRDVKIILKCKTVAAHAMKSKTTVLLILQLQHWMKMSG
jgi:hypothetical protein